MTGDRLVVEVLVIVVVAMMNNEKRRHRDTRTKGMNVGGPLSFVDFSARR
jgi:hypothetical protein